MTRLLLLLALLLIPSPLLNAANSSSGLYEIEIVVFQNKIPALDGNELWTRDQTKSVESDLKDTVISGETPTADSPLSSAVLALQNSGEHRVLAHLRWQQTAEARSVSKPVKITSSNGELNGALRLYSSRFLLVDVNLLLREAATGGIFSGPESDGPSYRLSERRRIKTSEINYFDHPKLGALVRVSPIKTN